MPYSPRYAGRARASRSRSGRLIRPAMLRLGRLLPLGRVLRLGPLLRLGVALLVALALSGCVAVQLKATVHSNNTLSGTSRVGISKSLAALSGGSAALLDSLKAQRPCQFAGNSASVKTYDDSSFIGVECGFAGLTLQQFNSGTTGPQLNRVGNRFELTGTFSLTDSLGKLPGLTGGGALPSSVPTDLSSLLPSDLASLLPTDLSSLLPSNLASLLPTDLSSLLPSGLPSNLSSLLPSGLPSNLLSLQPSGGASLPALDPAQILRTAKISFEFTFPGRVNSSTGKVRGRTVTFVPDANGNIDFRTVAAATPSSTGIGTTGWAGLAGLLLVVLGLAWLFARRRRGTALAAHGVPGPAEFGPAPYAGQPYSTQPYPGEPYPPQPQPGQPYPGLAYPGLAQPGQPYSTPPQHGGAYPPQPDAGYGVDPNPDQPYSGPPSWRPPQSSD